MLFYERAFVRPPLSEGKIGPRARRCPRRLHDLSQPAEGAAGPAPPGNRKVVTPLPLRRGGSGPWRRERFRGGVSGAGTSIGGSGIMTTLRAFTCDDLFRFNNM